MKLSGLSDKNIKKIGQLLQYYNTEEEDEISADPEERYKFRGYPEFNKPENYKSEYEEGGSGYSMNDEDQLQPTETFETAIEKLDNIYTDIYNLEDQVKTFLGQTAEHALFESNDPEAKQLFFEYLNRMQKQCGIISIAAESIKEFANKILYKI